MRYSPADEVVAVSVRADDEATVEVLDRGPGLVPDELDVIMDPFTRGRSGRSMPSGASLGLFIARRVFEAHECAPDRATRDGRILRVTFPLRAAVRTREAEAD